MIYRVPLQVSALAALLALSAAVMGAQPKTGAPPYGRIAKTKFKKLALPIGHLTIEYPDSKDWKLLPGQADVVVTIAETKAGEAAVVIEWSALRGAITPDAMPIAAENEAAVLREKQPDAANVQHQVMAADNRQFIVVQYLRPGVNGREQVVHYAFPIGTTMVRVICSTPEAAFTKYAPTFGHIAASVQAAPAPSGS